MPNAETAVDRFHVVRPANATPDQRATLKWAYRRHRSGWGRNTACGELHLPSTVITEYRDNDDYEKVVAEQMDFLWNAFGLDRCTEFDNAGRGTGE